MHALTHVITWSPQEKRWKRIDASTASRDWGGHTVSADKRVFVCELCKQYVLLTQAGLQPAHFRHNKNEDDKSCPDRVVSGGSLSYEPRRFSFPLKLSVSGNKVSFLLGLMIPREIANLLKETATEEKVSIQPINDGANMAPGPIKFSFDRLLGQGIVYLPVGDEPQKSYQIQISQPMRDILHWPQETPGIESPGAVFDGNSCKRIPLDGDIEVGRIYWLFTILNDLHLYKIPGLEIELQNIQIRSRSSLYSPAWKLYRIKAKDFKKESAEFFLQFKLRLTEKPIKLFPLWPLTIKRPYAVTCSEDVQTQIFYASGDDVFNRIYPKPATEPIVWKKPPTLLCLPINYKNLLVTSGRISVLKYLFLMQDAMPKGRSILEARDALCEIKTIDGEPVTEEIDHNQSILNPVSSNTIFCSPQFNGSVEIYKKMQHLQRIVLPAEQSTKIELHSGYHYDIFVGLELIQSFSYAPRSPSPRKRPDCFPSAKLVERPIPTAGALKLLACFGRTVINKHHISLGILPPARSLIR